MKQIAIVTGNCDECGAPIHPGKTQAAFNRNKGLHMRNVHGKVGKSNQKHLRYQANLIERGNRGAATPIEQVSAAVLKRRAYGRRWYKRKLKLARMTALPPKAAPKQEAMVPCKLSECPACNTRFYMVKGI